MIIRHLAENATLTIYRVRCAELSAKHATKNIDRVNCPVCLELARETELT